MSVIMDEAALAEFLIRDFPQVDGAFTVEEVTAAGIRMRLNVGAQHLRPGGTVSGPAMFGHRGLSPSIMVTLATDRAARR